MKNSQLVDGVSGGVKKDRLFIAVVSTGQSGHINPALNICKELCKRGHQVAVYTEDFVKNDFEKKIKQTGSECVFLDMQGNTFESLLAKSKMDGPGLFFDLEQMMLPVLEKKFAKSKPDVVLTDFATLAGASAAEICGIPLLINVPGPLSMMRGFLGWPDASTTWKLFGFFMTRQRLNLMTFAASMNIARFGTFGRRMNHYLANGAVMLVHTVWGLDQTAPLFPNIVMTGPVLPPALDLREQLAKEHVELHQFLRESDGAGAVYVTTGSHVKLHEWQVRVLYNGLKKEKGIRVVWSLKEELQQFLPVKDDPDFFISKWTPQAELLQDPAIKVVISHCGWGGTLETITAGKPIVAIPFLGDQPINATLLKDVGAAELIGKIPGVMDTPPNPWKEGSMTEDTVYSAVSKVMRNPSYTEAAQKLMRASQATGGVVAAAQQIEWAGWYGTSHLKPVNFKNSTASNPWTGVLLAVVAGVGAAVWLYRK
eukprot:Skav209551  [mRNA]  locus=scaffold2497:375448:376896:+ [translate_table: standard]